ncbi:hypothetical protein A3A84_00860 [Candidatus Collierbacteria bacterium RIFCSPLOWO2_01_FULL_50_23]|uniref:DNA-3-methyladenine glycosylase II n=1 Tax=Candidatus Collierbacteria bacterium RIFCSPHIGHO2_01_FULL_50_25 TaxID=1817722 RepID=A0A1F5EUM1_9BACT|nr:MAG: hypothetical protein A2703_01400 [Candidatus Collierbacteria bacterium RIFCSPHIGHO2_01_FULL_50_25]OGD74712.1 MAG: hypothetical protein A3A84_00860 [Candidatus Collierbacteria bacterium RIFCSPLOWO2_01_FULL_50_23]
MTSQPFSKDPILSSLIEKHQLKEYWGGQNSLFLNLVEIITGQQLSMKVADTIFKRFLALFPAKPEPADVLEVPVEKLRSVGLSSSKANCVRNIAQAASTGALLLDRFEKFTDEEIKKELIKIKGIGPWSAEMFLMFSLKRPDVFSVGDLGLRTAIEKLYGIKRDNLKKIEVLSQNWRPHRTLASRLLWASLE